MAENEPYLVSCNPLKPEYEKIRKIQLNCDNFTLGRGKHCSALIPVVLISRTHCTFKKVKNDEWTIEDSSLCGITINGDRLGKGAIRRLAHEDIITLEPTKEFVYKFVDPNSDMFEVPRKRIKLEPNVDDNLIKIKFEENQTYEMKHLEEKLHNTQQQMTTTKILKDQLELDMSRKMLQLENDFAEQIENLKGEKDEVERQKATLIEERDAQLAIVKDEMEGKIAELMDQIKKHNETETELLNENNLLKEKLLKEREEFMLELNRATSSKDELLQKLEAKAKEQEEIRLKEKQQWEEQLRIETELLTLAKEQEIQELEEQRKQREEALMQELDAMKRNLELQEEQTALQRREAEQQLSRQKEEMQKLSDEDKVKMEQLVKEREEIEKKLSEAEINAQKSIEEAKERVKERETQLAAIANERIQKEAEQSHEVISCLQQQLEKLRDQLKTVETEKNTLLETLGDLPVVEMGGAGEGSSKQAALAEVGELVENELQCSICAEQFIQATTLNCSHSFCKYCITMWKKKKKDCPICRAPITSECKSLVIDSFIEKMVETQSVEVRKKRQDLLKAREAEVLAITMATPTTSNQPRRRRNGRSATAATSRATTARTTTSMTTTATTTVTTTSTGTSSARSMQHSEPQIPIVDLTHLPIPTRPPPPRPYPPAQRLREVRLAQGGRGIPAPISFERQQVFQIVQPNGQTVLVVAGPIAQSPVSRVPTTAATGAATTASAAATGRPAAPTGSIQLPPPTTQ